MGSQQVRRVAMFYRDALQRALSRRRQQASGKTSRGSGSTHLCVEFLEERHLLTAAVGSFERLDGYAAASASAFVYPDPGELVIAPLASGEMLAFNSAMKSGPNGLAFMASEASAPYPDGSSVAAPFVSSAGHYDVMAEDGAHAGTTYYGDGAGAGAVMEYHPDPLAPVDLEFHGHLYLAAYGLDVISGGAYIWSNNTISASIGDYFVEATYYGDHELADGIWTWVAEVPDATGQVTRLTGSSPGGVNLHFYFTVDWDDVLDTDGDAGLTFSSGVSGEMEANAYFGGEAHALWDLVSASWGYVTAEGGDLGDGDGDGDGNEDDDGSGNGDGDGVDEDGDGDNDGVDGDDYNLWANGDPRGDYDLDGDVDAADFDVWANNAPDAIIVSTEVDENDGNHTANDLSLREAIGIAATRPGHDTIVFAPWVDSIAMTGGQFSINSGNNVAILGHGSDGLTINAQGNSRVFNIGSGVDAKISGLTVTGGAGVATGGGINNLGTLRLADVDVINNQSTSSGGGIYSNGSLTLSDSTVSSNFTTNAGGGVYGAGQSLIVLKSTISQNESRLGGGIYFAGAYASSGYAPSTLRIESSTIADNDADLSGGGLSISTSSYSSASVLSAVIRDSTIANNAAHLHGGGGLSLSLSAYDHVGIINSTISSNAAVKEGGGVALGYNNSYNLNSTAVTFTNATVANNIVTGVSTGAGIANNADRERMRLYNTIVADNLALGLANEIHGLVSVNSSYNLVGSVGTGGLINNNLGNIVLGAGQSAGLAPLGYYGGPTMTHALLQTSAAIDAGDNAKALALSLMFDQRGDDHDRIVDWDGVSGPRVDIGAFELAFGELYV